MDCRYNNWRYLFPIKVRRSSEDRGSYRESGVGGEDGVAVAEDDDVSAPHPEDLQHGDITLGREAGTLGAALPTDTGMLWRNWRRNGYGPA